MQSWVLPLQPCLVGLVEFGTRLQLFGCNPLLPAWDGAILQPGAVPFPHPLLRTLSPQEQPQSTAWLMGDLVGWGSWSRPSSRAGSAVAPLPVHRLQLSTDRCRADELQTCQCR